MPITNGHEVNVGCVIGGHHGWHGHAMLIAEARELGFPLSQDDIDLVFAYDADDIDHPRYDDLHEIVAGQGGIMDDAERWLNDNTPSLCTHCGQPVELTDSGAWWRHQSLGDEQACGIRMADTAQHYVWHWHDGEFFLSPMCDDETECDDETCAHWS